MSSGRSLVVRALVTALIDHINRRCIVIFYMPNLQCSSALLLRFEGFCREIETRAKEKQKSYLPVIGENGRSKIKQ